MVVVYSRVVNGSSGGMKISGAIAGVNRVYVVAALAEV